MAFSVMKGLEVTHQAIFGFTYALIAFIMWDGVPTKESH